MNSPLVSVIIPVFNAEEFVFDAIQSIVNQTYSNLEILICDDGSNDDSKKVIESINDERIIFLHNDENIGYLKTCNKLFEKANGEFIAFQDADDWSELSRIEKTLEVLLKDPSISMCGCNFIRDFGGSKLKSKSNYPCHNADINKYIEKHKNLPFCGASVILRKKVYHEIGGYKEFYDGIGYEHYDWFLRISEKFKVANIPDHLYNYRYSQNSFSRSNKLYDFKKFHAREIAFFLKKQRENYGSDGLTDPDLEQDFLIFLKRIENDFYANRNAVYEVVVKNHLSNQSFILALKIISKGFVSRELSFYKGGYLLTRVMRSFIAFLIKK